MLSTHCPGTKFLFKEMEGNSDRVGSGDLDNSGGDFCDLPWLDTGSVFSIDTSVRQLLARCEIRCDSARSDSVRD